MNKVFLSFVVSGVCFFLALNKYRYLVGSKGKNESLDIQRHNKLTVLSLLLAGGVIFVLGISDLLKELN